jgi:hypothetical protein
MPEAGTTKHENNTTAKFWLFPVIPAQECLPGLRFRTRIQFFLYGHNEPVFPLDCHAFRVVAMHAKINRLHEEPQIPALPFPTFSMIPCHLSDMRLRCRQFMRQQDIWREFPVIPVVARIQSFFAHDKHVVPLEGILT